MKRKRFLVLKSSPTSKGARGPRCLSGDSTWWRLRRAQRRQRRGPRRVGFRATSACHFRSHSFLRPRLFDRSPIPTASILPASSNPSPNRRFDPSSASSILPPPLRSLCTLHIPHSLASPPPSPVAPQGTEVRQIRTELSQISFRSERIFFSSSPSPSRDRSEELAGPCALTPTLAPCSTKCRGDCRALRRHQRGGARRWDGGKCHSSASSISLYASYPSFSRVPALPYRPAGRGSPANPRRTISDLFLI
ncbi:hypothetical protein ACMD2_16569 [Ananas comosus]|uniref:Uncharacterized protein n=1 Tax=Ananas comosus TaxID=4615 RepID=A0A199W7S3_ANACO|nr:hypothetical protein ACMD2_16569 [Ananas comosus]